MVVHLTVGPVLPLSSVVGQAFSCPTIADPSRSGLGKQAVRVLTETRAPRLILVSCDPVSLARDAGLLREAGYEHIRSTVYDLFPQTHHVEAVTTFQSRPSRSPT